MHVLTGQNGKVENQKIFRDWFPRKIFKYAVKMRKECSTLVNASDSRTKLAEK
jgi:hypothetical protein